MANRSLGRLMRREAQITETVERDERFAADIELKWDPAGGAFCVAFAALLIGTGDCFRCRRP